MTETISAPRPVRPHARRDWLVPAALILLVLIPIVAGAMRFTSLISGVETTPSNARFVTMPVPVIIHIISVTVYCVLGAFQFHAGLRRRRPRWHRIAGRVLVAMGVAAAASGLWMNLVYALPVDSYGVLWVVRWVVGLGMIAAIALGFAAVLRRDFRQHRAWMIRAYAIALGAGTQVLTSFVWFFIVGDAAATTTTVPLTAGWAINLVVAEWIIRRRPARRIQP